MKNFKCTYSLKNEKGTFVISARNFMEATAVMNRVKANFKKEVQKDYTWTLELAQ